jgi:hypothetical protein
MSMTSKEEVYTFQPRRIALGTEPLNDRRAHRGVIENLLKALSNIVAPRSRGRMRGQLVSVHHWERNRRR